MIRNSNLLDEWDKSKEFEHTLLNFIHAKKWHYVLIVTRPYQQIDYKLMDDMWEFCKTSFGHEVTYSTLDEDYVGTWYWMKHIPDYDGMIYFKHQHEADFFKLKYSERLRV